MDPGQDRLGRTGTLLPWHDPGSSQTRAMPYMSALYAARAANGPANPSDAEDLVQETFLRA